MTTTAAVTSGGSVDFSFDLTLDSLLKLSTALAIAYAAIRQGATWVYKLVKVAADHNATMREVAKELGALRSDLASLSTRASNIELLQVELKTEFNSLKHRFDRHEEEGH